MIVSKNQREKKKEIVFWKIRNEKEKGDSNLFNTFYEIFLFKSSSTILLYTGRVSAFEVKPILLT